MGKFLSTYPSCIQIPLFSLTNPQVLTAAIARQHCKDKEDRIPLKWTDLSLHERKHLQSLVNSELDAQGEAPVDERILHWRMNKAFYNMIKTRKGT